MTADYADRLDAARRVIAHRDELRAQTAGWMLDQQAAASRDATRILTATGPLLALVEPDRNWRQHTTTTDEIGDEPVARLLAAAWGCRPCIHLGRRGPAPTLVDLNHRRAQCPRCARTYRRPVDDGHCEVCGEPAGPIFTPFLIQLGALMIGGNAGACCAEFVTPEAAA
jgi:hypothetical protein